MSTLMSWLFPARAADGSASYPAGALGGLGEAGRRAMSDDNIVAQLHWAEERAKSESAVLNGSVRLSARGPYLHLAKVASTGVCPNRVYGRAQRVHFSFPTPGPQPTRLPGSPSLVPRCGEGGKWAIYVPEDADFEDHWGPCGVEEEEDDSCWTPEPPEPPGRLERWPRPPPRPPSSRLRAQRKPRQPRVLSMGPISPPHDYCSAFRGVAAGGRYHAPRKYKYLIRHTCSCDASCDSTLACSCCQDEMCVA